MLILISPAKKLDTATAAATAFATMPELLPHASTLITIARQLDSFALSELMKLSMPLASLNMQRFQQWHTPFTTDNAREAIFSFRGDVYQGMDADSFSREELEFAQQHLRILSGLYGVLRPLDLIQPYRLEMGTKLANHRGSDLYSFWKGIISDTLNRALDMQAERVLINLASEEYFRAVQPKAIQGRIVTPVFRENRNGTYKIISFNAKKARGLMSRFIIQNRLNQPEEIKTFDLADYRFSETMSTEDNWVFIRG
ncbi:peroxide stress protein YaaA [Mariprofundus erugo]|uniref:peroxide stress protein YaaA n=1 Tax=Mariprofundus erugo TaxID=2528639 RepID=UPI0010FD0503|nr:peroxide stress protein YaaA [Mariprofundus erugo]TLS74764.1 peroxide stress protein YaaA [Mariprofundus erugo]